MRSFLAIISIALSVAAQAQTYIPDAGFRNWLNWNFPGTLNGMYLDETHPSVVGATYLDLRNNPYNIQDVEGIHAFANCDILFLDDIPLGSSFFCFPPNITFLSAENCGLSYWPCVTPWNARYLRLANNNFTSFYLGGYVDLQEVDLSHNQLTSVDGLSVANYSLSTVNLSHNQLTTFGPNNNPPFSLFDLNISYNQFTEPELGASFRYNASHNQITYYPYIGADHIDLSYNNIDSISSFGIDAVNLDLSNNPLTFIPKINECWSLDISNTQISCLPWIPWGVNDINCTNTQINCLPNIPPSLDLDPAVLGFTPSVCPIGDPCHQTHPNLRLRMALNGPWDEVAQLMNDDLRQQGLIPLIEPYSALGYNYIRTPDSLTIDPSILTVTGNNAIVDWVVVEMRAGSGSNGPVRQSIPALLQRDGDVVDLNGDTLLFFNIDRGFSKVSVRHRNHVTIIERWGDNYWGAPPNTVDFMGSHANSCWGGAVTWDINFIGALWQGDVNRDHYVKYTGTGNDRDEILIAIGGTVPTAVLTGQYAGEDLNMDGTIKYTGANNDRDLILQAIGGTVPTNTNGQIPGGTW